MRLYKKYMRLISTIVFAFVVIFVTNAYAHVAVIVNKSNPVSDISYKELQQILEARKQYWDNGEKITLIFKPIASAETRTLIDTVYKIKYEEFDKYWFSMVYNGKITEFPKIVISTSTMNILVSEMPAAIAFLRIDEVSKRGNIKVLRIDGKMPDEDGYPLK